MCPSERGKREEDNDERRQRCEAAAFAGRKVRRRLCAIVVGRKVVRGLVLLTKHFCECDRSFEFVSSLRG